jgi:tRNA threonylcarbamoyladenosine biosynthesis protein TsaE
MPADTLQISYTLSNIENAVHQFWQYAHQYSVIAFNGDMGAGKTTFIHKLCDMLGVEDAVSSPTFALVNEYHFSDKGRERIIYHMDWYRLKGTEEAIDAGMEDNLLQKDNYAFIEWPEKAPELLPRPHISVKIETPAEGERALTAHIIE